MWIGNTAINDLRTKFDILYKNNNRIKCIRINSKYIKLIQ